jgi:hypothetical protein
VRCRESPTGGRVQRRIASRVLAFFAAGPGAAPATLDPFPGLTDREREILDLVARGLTNADIARRLVVSDKTVRNHVSNVFNQAPGGRPGGSGRTGPGRGLGAPGGTRAPAGPVGGTGRWDGGA